MPDNPYESVSIAEEPETIGISSAHAAYNVVSDTVTGLNVRKSDNKFQAIVVLVSVFSFATVGAILSSIVVQWNLPWYGGALIGAFAGLVIGVFSSGIFLMIYRAKRHIQGKHR